MNLTKRLFSVEKQHFNRLSTQAQRLIGTFFFFYLIFPIFTTFTMAFLWRQTQSVMTVSLFNLAVYLALPIGYYVNGHLLQKFLPARLYLTGVLCQAIFTAAVIFSPINTLSVLTNGFLVGLSAGLLWANRNLLILRITLNENRIYFSSLDSTINMLMGILIPLLIGTFIVFGQNGNIYTPIQAYYVLSLLMFIVIFFIFKRIEHIDTKLPELNNILLKKPTKQWTKMRGFGFIYGLLSGLTSFIPVIMVLLFVGHEDAVGTVQSLSAVVAAVIIYSIAKKISKEQRLWLIGTSVLCSILAGLSFAVLYSKLGVFMFFAFQSLAVPLGIIGYNALYFEIIEEENEKNNNHYAYMVDSEIFVDSGRILGILTLLILIHFSSNALALRYILSLFTIIQTLLFFISRSIERQQKIQLSDLTAVPKISETI